MDLASEMGIQSQIFQRKIEEAADQADPMGLLLEYEDFSFSDRLVYFLERKQINLADDKAKKEAVLKYENLFIELYRQLGIERHTSGRGKVDKYIRKWFEDQSPVPDAFSREDAIIICFNMEYNSAKADQFLEEVLGENALNPRDYREFVFRYAMDRPSKDIPYDECLSIIREYERRVDISTMEPTVGTETMRYIASDLASTASEQELLRYMLDHNANFIGYSKTALSTFEHYATEIYEFQQRHGGAAKTDQSVESFVDLFNGIDLRKSGADDIVNQLYLNRNRITTSAGKNIFEDGQREDSIGEKMRWLTAWSSLYSKIDFLDEDESPNEVLQIIANMSQLTFDQETECWHGELNGPTNEAGNQYVLILIQLLYYYWDRLGNQYITLIAHPDDAEAKKLARSMSLEGIPESYKKRFTDYFLKSHIKQISKLKSESQTKQDAILATIEAQQVYCRSQLTGISRAHLLLCIYEFCWIQSNKKGADFATLFRNEADRALSTCHMHMLNPKNWVDAALIVCAAQDPPIRLDQLHTLVTRTYEEENEVQIDIRELARMIESSSVIDAETVESSIDDLVGKPDEKHDFDSIEPGSDRFMQDCVVCKVIQTADPTTDEYHIAVAILSGNWNKTEEELGVKKGDGIEKHVIRQNEDKWESIFGEYRWNNKPDEDTIAQYWHQLGNQVTRYQKRIKSICSTLKPYRKDASYRELYLAGAQGMIKAAAKFDPSKRTLLTTYSNIFIKNAVFVRLVEDWFGDTSNASVTRFRRASKLRRFLSSFDMESADRPTFDEMRIGMGLTDEHARGRKILYQTLCDIHMMDLFWNRVSTESDDSDETQEERLDRIFRKQQGDESTTDDSTVDEMYEVGHEDTAVDCEQDEESESGVDTDSIDLDDEQDDANGYATYAGLWGHSEWDLDGNGQWLDDYLAEKTGRIQEDIQRLQDWRKHQDQFSSLEQAVVTVYSTGTYAHLDIGNLHVIANEPGILGNQLSITATADGYGSYVVSITNRLGDGYHDVVKLNPVSTIEELIKASYGNGYVDFSGAGLLSEIPETHLYDGYDLDSTVEHPEKAADAIKAYLGIKKFTYSDVKRIFARVAIKLQRIYIEELRAKL